MEKPRILIVGGGFAGIFCAKKLHDLLGKSVQITLVTKNPHFEYHAALYRVVNDGTPLQACVPLKEIFKNTDVEIIVDTIDSLDTKDNTAININNEKYHYDFLILGLGSENTYFKIPGLNKYSYSMRSIEESLKLSRHIHDTLNEHIDDPDNQHIMEIAVIGAGPAGVELTGQLAVHTKQIASNHHLPSSSVRVELIEAFDRVLPSLTPVESEIITKRLEALGVTVRTSTKVLEGLETGLKTDGGTIKTRTVIWTAGAKANSLYERWNFVTGKGSKVSVNEFLQPQIPQQKIPGSQALEGLENKENSSPARYFKNIYIIGDGAEASGSGQALPAKKMGETAALNIYNYMNNYSLKKYTPPLSVLIMPVGPAWAFSKISVWKAHGLVGSFVQKLWTLYFFSLLLSPSRAFSFLLKEGRMRENLCHTCASHNEDKLY